MADLNIKTWQERYNAMGTGPSFSDKAVAMLAEIDDLRAALESARRAVPAQASEPTGEVDDLDDALNTMLWLLRRLPRAYGLPPFVKHSVRTLAKKTGTEVSDFLAEQSAAPAPLQGGQSAPGGWKVERVGDAIHIKRADGRWCGYMADIDSPAHRLTHEFLSALLAAAAPGGGEPSGRVAVLEQAARIAEQSDIETVQWCGQTLDDGSKTRESIATAIRAAAHAPAQQEPGHGN